MFGKTGVTRAVPERRGRPKLATILSGGAPDELKFNADASTSPHNIYSVMATYVGASEKCPTQDKEDRHRRE